MQLQAQQKEPLAQMQMAMQQMQNAAAEQSQKDQEVRHLRGLLQQHQAAEMGITGAPPAISPQRPLQPALPKEGKTPPSSAEAAKKQIEQMRQAKQAQTRPQTVRKTTDKDTERQMRLNKIAQKQAQLSEKEPPTQTIQPTQREATESPDEIRDSPFKPK